MWYQDSKAKRWENAARNEFLYFPERAAQVQAGFLNRKLLYQRYHYYHNLYFYYYYHNCLFKPGRCVGLRDCNNILVLLKRPIPDPVSQYLR